MSSFIRNAWYVAAWSKEVGRGYLTRRILNEPVLMYRKQDGTAVALLDRCSHKLAPLSLGELKGDIVECGYHGLQFDCNGTCVRVPGQPQIPPSAKVKSFPLVERYNAVWIWMGDPALANPDDIVKVERYQLPGWELIDGQYLHFKSNYLNITDNLVDPAHTTYVHKNTIGNAAGENVAVKVEQGDNHVLAYRWIENAEPIPLAKKMGDFKGLTDRWQYYYLLMPSISYVDFGTVDAGVEHKEETMNRGLRSFSYNFLTPETESTTHYFWLHIRNYQIGKSDVDADVTKLMTLTFEEDMAILAAVQKAQEETGVREYVRLGIDNAPARIRKMVDKRIAAERHAAEERNAPVTREELQVAG
jgi:vanillate O-demethylase monooxygenase subunit